MKASNIFTVLLGGSLLLSASVFAGNTNRKSLHLTDSVTVQGKQLKPGNYTVEWEGSGPNVELNIVQGSKTVVSAPAHVVYVNAPNLQDGYTSLAEKNGSQSIQQLFFRGEKFDLELGQASGANATPSATNGTN